MINIEGLKQRAIEEEAKHLKFLIKEVLEVIERKINSTLRRDLDAKHLVILDWRTSGHRYYYGDGDDCELETLFDNKIVFEHVQKELAALNMTVRRVDVPYRKFFIFLKRKKRF